MLGQVFGGITGMTGNMADQREERGFARLGLGMLQYFQNREDGTHLMVGKFKLCQRYL